MKDLRIAFIPLIRSTFDVALATQMIDQARQALSASGMRFIGPVEPVSDISTAQAAAAELANDPIDLLLIFQATFADSSMVTTLVEGLDTPIFLWAVPEPWTGERLRLNSLCGINLAGHALTLRKRQYDYAYGLPGDPRVMKKISSAASAGALYRRLKSVRLGVIGEHPLGMDSCHLDEASLRTTFGISIEKFTLAEVFTRARSIPAPAIAQARSLLDASLDNLASLDQAPLSGTISVYRALKDMAEEHHLDGLAVRCWPEFFTEMGCAACGAMSMLSDGFGNADPLPCSCEADINGTVTQFLLQALSDIPAFGTDMVGVDLQKNHIALWHCGLAPFSMADPNVQAHGGIHSNRRVPLVMDFPLKPGVVTVARLSQATGSLRLVLGKGEILAEPKPFSGTAGILKLQCSAQAFLNLLMHEGLEHHVSLTYGDHVEKLQAFARLANLPVLTIGEEEVKE